MKEILKNVEIMGKDEVIPAEYKCIMLIRIKLLHDLDEVLCALEKPLCILKEYDEDRVACYYINERARDLSISEIKKHCLRHHNKTARIL